MRRLLCAQQQKTQEKQLKITINGNQKGKREDDGKSSLKSNKIGKQHLHKQLLLNRKRNRDS